MTDISKFPGQGTGGLILIVDDDQRNIFALKAVLKAKGFSCLSAAAAEEAIHLMLEGRGIKFVLLDMMMPDMDGYEAINHIRSNENIAGTPIIAVTAQAMVGDREKALAAGADNYASKPIDVDFLTEILNEHLA